MTKGRLREQAPFLISGSENGFISFRITVWSESSRKKTEADLPLFFMSLFTARLDFDGMAVVLDGGTIRAKPTHNTVGEPIYREYELVNFFR